MKNIFLRRSHLNSVSRALLSATLAWLTFCAPALALDVNVIGVFPGKAVLVIDNAQPKTYSVGANLGENIKLFAVDSNSATLDIGGKKSILPIGQHINRSAPSSSSKLVLQADGGGHFQADAQINGGSLRMLLDTGATLIAIPGADAKRLGIDYKRGQPGYSETANGRVMVYKVKLDTVKLGDLEMHAVDAVVVENGLNIGLLGMSFLNRTEMHREGTQITLIKRY